MMEISNHAVDMNRNASMNRAAGRQYPYSYNQSSSYMKFEALIKEQSNFYSVLMDHVVAGVFVVYDNTFIYVNSYFAQLLGYAVEEIVGQKVDRFIEEEDWLLPQSFEGILDSEITKRQIFRWNGKHKNSSIVYFEGKSTTIKHDGIIYYLSTVQDVTIKYEKERELIRNAKMYQRMLMTIPEPIFITVDHSIVFANRHGLDLLGKRHVSGLTEQSFLDYFDVKDREDVALDFQSALLLEEATPFRQQQMKISDRVIEVEHSSVKIENYIGRTAILTVLRDLTERRQDEERLVRSEKLSVIGQLAAGVAHEIRNPLTALKGFTQLLRNKYTEHSYYFDIMGTEIDRINLIVNEFMTLAKPHYSSFQFNDIVHIVQSVLSILETQAALYGVELDFQAQQDLPNVHCNENQLKQVFINVIKNAIEAMQDGGRVIITIRFEPLEQMLHVKIKDHGIGMPDDVQKRIGEPFLTTKEKGTGLGLMVSSRIIEEHKGTMLITSKAGEGTLIDIQLPIHMENIANG
ncbi:ATP-binding protein [Paenibacillus sp. FSL W7-1287]|uniref:ATP-binding protein n=1 Tax=Paenibacillus sp. FSL W7-1287 TaxID=2954538 RepID=UPI0030FA5F1F